MTDVAAFLRRTAERVRAGIISPDEIASRLADCADILDADGAQMSLEAWNKSPLAKARRAPSWAGQFDYLDRATAQ